MKFADRLAVECMMNKGMYAKYQAAQQKTQKTSFQLKKEQYRDEIQDIVRRLLTKEKEKEEEKDTNNQSDNDDANKEEEEEEEEEDANKNEMILHPKVINHFNDFVSACIENLDDFQDEANKTEKEREEEEAPFFTEDSDEEKYHNNYENEEEEEEEEDSDQEKRRNTKRIIPRSDPVFSVFNSNQY